MRSRDLVARGADGLSTSSAFAATIAFYGCVALPLARKELARWADRAETITDPSLRQITLSTLQQQRMNSEGAAAFAVLYPPAAKRLVPLLVAYQLTWDVVDSLLENPDVVPAPPEAVRGTLEAALGLTPTPPAVPMLACASGGGFLDALVRACRISCSALPRYWDARPALLRATSRTDALLVSNAPPADRALALAAWGSRHGADWPELEPAELCAAAHCSLVIHALLATAAAPWRHRSDFDVVESAYFPWVDALCTLLDSAMDQGEDERAGDFNFILSYSSPAVAARRMGVIADRAFARLRALPAARRHRVLVGALVGMYLSAPGAATREGRLVVGAVIDATPPLSRWARTVLRAQRTVLS